MATRPPQRRTRRRRILFTALAVFGVLLVAGLVALLTLPRWAGPRIARELEQRLANRLELEVHVDEFEMSWQAIDMGGVELDGEGLHLVVDAVHVELDRSALWSARMQVVEAEARGGSLDAEAEALESLARRLESIASADEDEGSRSWWRRRLSLTPELASASEIAVAVQDGARRVTGQASATADLDGRSVDLRLESMRADLGIGPPLRADALDTHVEQRDASLRFPLRVRLEGASAQLDENVAVAGVAGSVSILDAELAEIGVELTGGFAEIREGEGAAGEGAQLWSVSGRFARDLSAGSLEVDMEAFELGRVPDVLERLPVVDSDKATIGGQLQIDFGEGVARLDGDLAVAGLNVSHPLLAREVVHDVGFGLDIEAEIDPDARHLSLERLAVARAGVELIATGDIVHAAVREQRRYRVDLEVPEVDCQKVLDAIPRELAPGLAEFELDGVFQAKLAIEADFSKLDDLRLEGAIDADRCRVNVAPRRASAAALNRGFSHRVTMRDGRTRTVRLVPGSSSYTPLANISRYMTEAVLTTEDGSFRRHEGFNTTQLEAALRRNLKAGKIRLGASTITMQMVKNVLLSHERTLSRKLQELFLTWWVEEALSKQRIMELYLNVIEFGPGIYGVTNASRHYFGKHPAELTSLEAAYLALMLPSPVRRHVHYCNGELTERFTKKLDWIHDLMLERERITASEHAIYGATPLVFDLLERGDPELCLAEIEELMAGTHTQRALSGLMGDGDESAFDAASGWAGAVETGPSWGVRPPLPSAVDLPVIGGEGADGEPGEADVDGRLQPRENADWFEGPGGDPSDPASADAPGRPAMDDG